VSQNRLASDSDGPVSRIAAIVRSTRAIADTALRLAGYLGTAPKVWTSLQASPTRGWRLLARGVLPHPLARLSHIVSSADGSLCLGQARKV